MLTDITNGLLTAPARLERRQSVRGRSGQLLKLRSAAKRRMAKKDEEKSRIQEQRQMTLELLEGIRQRPAPAFDFLEFLINIKDTDDEELELDWQ